jgi:DNA-binding GntR family transcriptional regulator
MKEHSLANLVYTEIRKKILANQLTSGARLVESAWAKKLNVSRVAVREGLIRLSGERLVEFGEKGGCFVRSITAEDVIEIKELREILEVGALKLLFKRKDNAILKKLEQICDDFSSMVERGYLSGACEADVRFHETIIEGAKNLRLQSMYDNSNIPLFHFKIGSSTQMDDYAQTNKEHRSIVIALKKNDLQSAKNTLLKHLERGEKEMLELVPDEGTGIQMII